MSPDVLPDRELKESSAQSCVCLFVCLSVTLFVFEFSYTICVEVSLRGRHSLRGLCISKTRTSQDLAIELSQFCAWPTAQVPPEALLAVALHAMYDTAHRVFINRYCHTSRYVNTLYYVLADCEVYTV